eukprot:jgi/Tetstr1/440008/TSEL_028369.t1
MASKSGGGVVSVLVPGFEPLEYGLTAPKKWEYFHLAFNLPGADPMEHQKVSFIVTARENTAMEALSWHRAHELHQSQFHPATSAAADTAPSTATTNGSSSVVDLRKYRRWLRFTEKANRQLEQAVVRYRRPTLRVKYEDFLERPTHTMRGVFAFLGLDPPPPDASAQHRAIFQKTNDGIPSHLVANHREWCELLRRRRRRYAQQGECPPAGWHRANGSGHG